MTLEEHDTWRLMWISAAGGGALFMLYGFTEGQAVQQSNDTQNSLLSRIGDTTGISRSTYDSLKSQIASKAAEAGEHKQNSDLGYLLALGLLGTAAWVYYHPPGGQPPPPLLSFSPAHGGSARIQLTVTW
ncbi:MAG: hypothetical protein HY342_03410 [Candidatus Lambdaproteobacteria bacterium]|nr:hypothetical protein [Candidatus Lambdaproteobacteria bacterium]